MQFSQSPPRFPKMSEQLTATVPPEAHAHASPAVPKAIIVFSICTVEDQVEKIAPPVPGERPSGGRRTRSASACGDRGGSVLRELSGASFPWKVQEENTG
jgi:hypothetical protein